MLLTDDAPILEFDPDPVGLFDPEGQRPDGVVPRYAVARHWARSSGAETKNVWWSRWRQQP